VVERFGVFDVGARHGVPVHESVTLEAVGALRESPLPESEGKRTVAGAALVATLGQPQGLPPRPAGKTQNRGNEAKKSLKTKCWVKMECAKRTPFCTPEAPNEANKVEFRSAVGVAKREAEM